MPLGALDRIRGQAEVAHETSSRGNHFGCGFIAFGARSGARQGPEHCSQCPDLQSERGGVVEKQNRKTKEQRIALRSGAWQ